MTRRRRSAGSEAGSWLDGESHAIEIAAREQLVAARAHIVVVHVRYQQRRFANNVQLGGRLVGLAGELTSRLVERISLDAGVIVRYVGHDDVDNHFGRYRFITDDDVQVVVIGDASTPRSGPLGEVHRYLEQLPA